ncbi:MAG: hypothetical protein QW320_10865 [Ignisphaera sp.]
MLWKKLYNEIPVESRRLVDINMLQWNRADRVPLTYNVKENDTRFCRVIYPREFFWRDFSWRELEPLDPASVRPVKIIVPQVVKPKIIASTKHESSWVWRIVESGLPDGRKRFILHVLVPYLVNVVNKREDEVLEVCREFPENSCRNRQGLRLVDQERYQECKKPRLQRVRAVQAQGERPRALQLHRERCSPELATLA